MFGEGIVVLAMDILPGPVGWDQVWSSCNQVTHLITLNEGL